MSEECYANYLFSPNFMHYLDYEKLHNRFIIRETISQDIKCIVPKGLMSPKGGDEAAKYARNFRWIDNTTIKILNDEGIEKMVDVENEFLEEASGRVPFYEITIGKKYKHFYFHRSSFKLGEVFDRLIRKYQGYKQAYYLENK